MKVLTLATEIRRGGIARYTATHRSGRHPRQVHDHETKKVSSHEADQKMPRVTAAFVVGQHGSVTCPLFSLASGE